jgi:uncharacterized protein (DUF1015 family)
MLTIVRMYVDFTRSVNERVRADEDVKIESVYAVSKVSLTAQGTTKKINRWWLQDSNIKRINIRTILKVLTWGVTPITLVVWFVICWVGRVRV